LRAGGALLPFLLVMPVAFGRLLHLGIYHYMLDFPAFLVFASLWRRYGEKRTAAVFVMFVAALLIIGLTHLSTVAAVCLFMAASGIARVVGAFGREPFGALVRRLVGDGTWSLAIAAPALIFLVSFVLAYPTATAETAMLQRSVASVLKRLFGLAYLYSFSVMEVVVLLPIGAAVVAYVFVAIRAALAERRVGDLVWPIFVLLLVLVSLSDPRTAQGFRSPSDSPRSPGSESRSRSPRACPGRGCCGS
jgi:hypothetical protein